MYQPFETMPPPSRLWVYQANRLLSDSEKALVDKSLRELCDQWTAHGAPLHTSFAVHYNQFIVLAIDEDLAGASGCSIDGSVRILKNLQETAGLDFFDRSKVAFLIGDAVVLHPMSELEKLFKTKTLSADTLTFNNTVTTKEAWEQQWKIPARNTWLARYLPKSNGRNPARLKFSFLYLSWL
ncbi:MAG: hypothetical protein SH819_05540 [Cytophagales bacterium]|nr:hypothetical protein [Cytophagales bacterium]